MSTLPSTIAAGLAGYFEMVRSKVHEWVGPLSTEQIWRRPYPYGNSVGNLLLHLTGNLNYYIGAQIGGTGYVRHRDREFADTGKGKEHLLRDFDQAVEMVINTIKKQTPEDWSRAFSGQGVPPAVKTRFDMVLNCAGHAYHHLGQIIYLQKQLTMSAAKSGD
jgi:uncharacterized damage-inducible protein DinB